jgi:hypothetical protein
VNARAQYWAPEGPVPEPPCREGKLPSLVSCLSRPHASVAPARHASRHSPAAATAQPASRLPAGMMWWTIHNPSSSPFTGQVRLLHPRTRCGALSTLAGVCNGADKAPSPPPAPAAAACAIALSSAPPLGTDARVAAVDWPRGAHCKAYARAAAQERPEGHIPQLPSAPLAPLCCTAGPRRVQSAR